MPAKKTDYKLCWRYGKSCMAASRRAMVHVAIDSGKDPRHNIMIMQ